MKHGFGWEGQIKEMRIIGGGPMEAHGFSPNGLQNSQTIGGGGPGRDGKENTASKYGKRGGMIKIAIVK